jgi:hypothetical protein
MNNDEDFMNELQELTQSMSKEFTQDKSTASNKPNSYSDLNSAHAMSGSNLFNMDMNFEGTEKDYLKEIEKLIGSFGNINSGLDLNLDDSDPQTKEMMKLFSENLKDFELKMNDMQKNIPNESNSNNENNNESNKQENQNKNVKSNPFVETFREMKDDSIGNSMNDFLKMFEQGGLGGGDGDIKNLYDILGKLSDNKDGGEPVNEEQEKVKLESLFGNLLEFLLKGDMLSEPLNQIKESVIAYLEKNKGKLTLEEEDKYKSMITSIDTILEEINKKEPNKELVIDIFYKLHEMSDIDSEILPKGDNTFKQFSELFNSNLK